MGRGRVLGVLGPGRRPWEHPLPSSSRVKDKKVVSSFRFRLNSMHSRLSLFLMLLISWREAGREGAVDRGRPQWASDPGAQAEGWRRDASLPDWIRHSDRSGQSMGHPSALSFPLGV